MVTWKSLRRALWLKKCLALTVVAAINMGAQSSPPARSVKGVTAKNRVPVNPVTLRVELPRPREATLSNGLRVLLLEDRRLPTFSIQLVVFNGGVYEPPDQRGITSSTAWLLREGTAERRGRDIAAQIDSLGLSYLGVASISGLTTNLSISGLIENLDPALDVFSDVVRNPQFPEAEVLQYKVRTAAQMKELRSSPAIVANQVFHRAILGGHPGAIVSMQAEPLSRLTSEDLKRHHRTFFRPNNSLLAVTGDLTMAQLLPKLEKHFGGWEPGKIPAARKLPEVVPPTRSVIHIVDRPNSVQTTIHLGTLGIERDHPDYFAVLVMNEVLGGSPASRLFMNLREDKGYTYGAYSNFGRQKYRTGFFATAEVRTEVTDAALREFMRELARLRDEIVSPTELQNAKRALVGGFALSLEQPSTLLANAVTQKLYKFPANYWDAYPRRVDAVRAKDVMWTARKYLQPNRLQIVVVGDAKLLRTTLGAFGPVEVLNDEGMPPGGR